MSALKTMGGRRLLDRTLFVLVFGVIPLFVVGFDLSYHEFWRDER